MKALTIRQPHCELIVSGVRCEPEALGEHDGGGVCFETRSWPTGYRGPLLLHAGKRFDVGRTHVPAESAHEYVRSAFVARAQLVGCVPIVETAATHYVSAQLLHNRGMIVLSADRARAAYYRPGISTGELSHDLSRQLPFGRFEPGSFAWLLARIERLDAPIPAAGRQGLWEVRG